MSVFVQVKIRSNSYPNYSWYYAAIFVADKNYIRKLIKRFCLPEAIVFVNNKTILGRRHDYKENVPYGLSDTCLVAFP